MGIVLGIWVLGSSFWVGNKGQPAVLLWIGDRVRFGDMSEIVKDPEILGGMPVFAGTRVPVKNLFDALIGGDSIPEFLDDFPTVTFEQVQAVLAEAEHAIENPVAA